MCVIQSGKNIVVVLPNFSPEEQKQIGEGISTIFLLQIVAIIVIFVLAPIWEPFAFIENLFDNFVKQISYDGWIIDPITRFTLLSIEFILFSPICFFVIIPLYLAIINFCVYLFRKVKIKILRFFRKPIIPNQPKKFLIKTKVLIALWILSLLVLPLVAFKTQIGLQYFLGTITRSYAENVQFHKFKQNPFDQLELLNLEKKYSLKLNSEDREFMLDITGTKSKNFPIYKGSSRTWSWENKTIYTNLGTRSSVILFYDELVRLGNKYHLKMNIEEKLTILDLSERIAKMHRKTEDEIISDHDILKFLEYSVISTIAEDRALKQITSFTSDELKLFGKLEPNKLWLPRFARNRSIELTKLWRHDLSNHQKKVFYENYCYEVVNSIYRAYHVESGYLPGKNDAKMIKSEAKNPRGNPDFNDCRKFLINKGYQLSNGAMFVYFYKP